jgi:predicted Fe-S protein YdhL (DUF1289 family)
MFPAAAARETTIERPLIESPCTKVCTVDARSGLCLGCGRTVNEIASWTAMSSSERARVMGELSARLAAISPAQSAGVAG